MYVVYAEQNSIVQCRFVRELLEHSTVQNCYVQYIFNCTVYSADLYESFLNTGLYRTVMYTVQYIVNCTVYSADLYESFLNKGLYRTVMYILYCTQYSADLYESFLNTVLYRTVMYILYCIQYSADFYYESFFKGLL